MTSIAEIVQTAVGTDNERRKEAEAYLTNLMASEPDNFAKEMMKLFNSENTPPFLRQASGLILKRTVSQKINDHIYWTVVSNGIREEIKNCLLCLLLSKEHSIVQTSASLISEIFTVELPLNTWPSLIPSIASNTKHQEISVRKAAISTLGYICEAAKRGNLGKFISRESSEQIMSGIMLGLDASTTDYSIAISALKALSDSMSFFEEIYAKKEVRDFVLSKIGTFLSHDSHDVKKEVISCLIDYAKVNYKYMGESIAALFQALVPLINGDDDIAIPGVEFFNTLAMEDKDKGQQILLSVTQFLVPLLIEQLIRSENEEEDFEECDLTLESTAYTCLSSVLEVYGQHCLEIVLNLVQAMLTQGKKVPALLCVMAALEIPQKEKLNSLLNFLLTPSSPLSLRELMNNNSNKVQEAASLCYSKIAENSPSSYFHSNFFPNHVQDCIAFLEKSPKVSRNICFCLSSLSAEANNYNTISVMKEAFEKIATSLMNNCYRGDLNDENAFLISANMVALMSLFEYVADSQTAFKYLAVLTEKIGALYAFPKSVARDILETGLFTVTNTCVYKSASSHNSSSVEFLINLAFQSFNNHQCVTTDGMFLFSAVINCKISLYSANSQFFEPHIQKVWPYIQEALKNEAEIDLWVAVLGLISDISRRCPNTSESYVLTIIDGLVKCFQNPSIERRVKSSALTCMGDLALGLSIKFAPFLDEVLKVMEMAYGAAYQLRKSNSLEDMDYAEELSEVIVESFTGIVHGTVSTELESKVKESSLKIIPFLFYICSKELKPPVDLMRKCLFLLIDMISFYKGDVMILVKNQFYTQLQQLVQNLSSFRHNKKNAEAINYAVGTLKSL